ncbi:unnamed protein product [Bursaphelenchus okinawaensis]|uniref:Aminotransferase class I/classII large domain-containing protein n=1 Tax=Bursaphelenchus okinawaensis TaxID=465554 RepID=A0A811L5Z8_9BILA|nr:unnamed protein product [Bursaphelenchus okinawaensis]CAG9118390.1 unnamed protein product [Bursaphelenchus okinawaensis]
MFLLASITNDLLQYGHERSWRSLGRRHSAVDYAPSCSWSEFTDDPNWLVHRMEPLKNWHSQHLDNNSNMKSTSSVLAKRAQNLLANRELAKTYREVYEDHWNLEQNPQGKINLCTAENTLCEDLLVEKINDPKIWHNLFPTIHHYQPSGGLEWVKTAAADYIDKFVSINGDPSVAKENLVIVPGCAAAYDMIGCCLFEANEAVLAPVPFYVRLADNWGERAHVRVMPVLYNDLNKPTLRPELFQAALGEATLKGIKVKAISLINPNNPLGHVFPEKDVFDVCKWAVSNDLFIIADEVFASTTEYAQRFRSMLSLRHQLGVKHRKKVIWMWGVSKDLCLPGARFAIVHTELEDLQKGLRRLEILQPCSPIAQHLIGHLLRDHTWIQKFHVTKNQRLEENRKFACKKLEDYGIQYLPTDSGLFLFIDFREYIKDDTFEAENVLWKRFTRSGVYMNPGSFMGSVEPGWFRLVISCARSELEEGLRRLHDILLIIEKRQIDRPKSAVPTELKNDQSFIRIQSGDDLMSKVFGLPLPVFGALSTSTDHIEAEYQKIDKTHIDNTPFNILDYVKPQKKDDTAEAFGDSLNSEEEPDFNSGDLKEKNSEGYGKHHEGKHNHSRTSELTIDITTTSEKQKPELLSDTIYNTIFASPTTTVQGGVAKSDNVVQQTSFTSSTSPVQKERFSLSKQYFISKGVTDPEMSESTESKDTEDTMNQLYNEFQIPIPKQKSTVSVQHSKAVNLSDERSPSITEVLARISPPASEPTSLDFEVDGDKASELTVNKKDEKSIEDNYGKPSKEAHYNEDQNEYSVEGKEQSKYFVEEADDQSEYPLETHDKYDNDHRTHQHIQYSNSLLSPTITSSQVSPSTSVITDEEYERIFTPHEALLQHNAVKKSYSAKTNNNNIITDTSVFLKHQDANVQQKMEATLSKEIYQKIFSQRVSSADEVEGREESLDDILADGYKDKDEDIDKVEEITDITKDDEDTSEIKKDSEKIVKGNNFDSVELKEPQKDNQQLEDSQDNSLVEDAQGIPEKPSESSEASNDHNVSSLQNSEANQSSLKEIQPNDPYYVVIHNQNRRHEMDPELWENVFNPPTTSITTTRKVQKTADDSKITTDLAAFSRQQHEQHKRNIGKPTLTDDQLAKVFGIDKKESDYYTSVVNHSLDEASLAPDNKPDLSGLAVDVREEKENNDKVQHDGYQAKPEPQNYQNKSSEDKSNTEEAAILTDAKETTVTTYRQLSGFTESHDLIKAVFSPIQHQKSEEQPKKTYKLADDSNISTDLSAFSRSQHENVKRQIGSPTLTDQELSAVFATQSATDDKLKPEATKDHEEHRNDAKVDYRTHYEAEAVRKDEDKGEKEANPKDSNKEKHKQSEVVSENIENDQLLHQVFSPVASTKTEVTSKKLQKPIDDSKISTDLSAFSKHKNEESRKALGQPTFTDEEIDRIFKDQEREGQQVEVTAENKTVVEDTEAEKDMMPVEQETHDEHKKKKIEKTPAQIQESEKPNELLHQVFSPIPTSHSESTTQVKKLQKPVDDSKITTDLSAFSKRQHEDVKRSVGSPTLTDQQLAEIFEQKQAGHDQCDSNEKAKVAKTTYNSERDVISEDHVGKDQEGKDTREVSEVSERIPSEEEAEYNLQRGQITPEEKVAEEIVNHAFSEKLEDNLSTLDKSNVSTENNKTSTEELPKEEAHKVPIPEESPLSKPSYVQLSLNLDDVFKPEQSYTYEELKKAQQIAKYDSTKDSAITLDTRVFNRKTEEEHHALQPTLSDDKIHEILYPRYVPLGTIKEYSKETDDSNVIHKEDQKSQDDMAFGSFENPILDSKENQYLKDANKSYFEDLIAHPPLTLPKHILQPKESVSDRQSVSSNEHFKSDVSETTEHVRNEDFEEALERIHKLSDSEQKHLNEYSSIDIMNEVFEYKPDPYFAERHNTSIQKTVTAKTNPELSDGTNFPRHEVKEAREKVVSPTLTDDEYRLIFEEPNLVVAPKSEAQYYDKVKKEEDYNQEKNERNTRPTNISIPRTIETPKEEKNYIKEDQTHSNKQQKDEEKEDQNNKKEEKQTVTFGDEKIHHDDLPLTPLPGRRYTDSMFDDNVFELSQEDLDKYGKFIDHNQDSDNDFDYPYSQELTDIDEKGESDTEERKLSPSLQSFEKTELAVRQSVISDDVFHSEQHDQKGHIDTVTGELKPHPKSPRRHKIVGSEDILDDRTSKQTENVTTEGTENSTEGKSDELPQNKSENPTVDQNTEVKQEVNNAKLQKQDQPSPSENKTLSTKLKEGLSNIFTSKKDKKPDSAEEDDDVTYKRMESIDRTAVIEEQNSTSSDAQSPSEYIDKIFESTFRNQESLSDDEALNHQSKDIVDEAIRNVEGEYTRQRAENKDNMRQNVEEKENKRQNLDEQGHLHLESLVDSESEGRQYRITNVMHSPSQNRGTVHQHSNENSSSGQERSSEAYQTHTQGGNGQTRDQDPKELNYQSKNQRQNHKTSQDDSEDHNVRVKDAIKKLNKAEKHATFSGNTTSHYVKSSKHHQSSPANSQQSNNVSRMSSPPMSPLHVDTNYQPLSSSTLKRQDYRERRLNDSGIGMDSYHAPNAITVEFPLIVTSPKEGLVDIKESREQEQTIDDQTGRYGDDTHHDNGIKIVSNKTTEFLKPKNEDSAFSTSMHSELRDHLDHTMTDDSLEHKKRRYVKKREYHKGQYHSPTDRYYYRNMNEYSDSDHLYTDASFEPLSPEQTKPVYHFRPVDFDVTIRSNSPKVRSRSQETVSFKDDSLGNSFENEFGTKVFPQRSKEYDFSHRAQAVPVYHLRQSKSSSALEGSHDFASIIEDYNQHLNRKRAHSPTVSVTTHNRPYSQNQQFHQVHHDLYLERRPGTYYSTSRVGSVVVEHTNVTEIVHDKKDERKSRAELVKTKTTTRVESLEPRELLDTLVFEGEPGLHRNERAEKYVEYRHRRSRAPNTTATRISNYVVHQRDTTEESDSDITDFQRTSSGRYQRGVQTKETIDLCCRMRLIKAVHQGDNGPEQAEYVMCRNPNHADKHDHCNPKRLYAVKRSTIPRTQKPKQYTIGNGNDKITITTTADFGNSIDRISMRRSPNQTWLVSSVQTTNKYNTIERDHFASSSETDASVAKIRSKLY